MAAVKSTHTGLEEQFAQMLRRADINGWRRYPKGVLGNPDVVFRDQRVAVFVDSCFWHGCPLHLRRPNSHRGYWQAKIDRNAARDRRNRAALRKHGWAVVRVWEHEFNPQKNPLGRLKRALRDRGNRQVPGT